jgi:hypothetical protein
MASGKLPFRRGCGRTSFFVTALGTQPRPDDCGVPSLRPRPRPACRGRDPPDVRTQMTGSCELARSGHGHPTWALLHGGRRRSRARAGTHVGATAEAPNRHHPDVDRSAGAVGRMASVNHAQCASTGCQRSGSAWWTPGSRSGSIQAVLPSTRRPSAPGRAARRGNRVEVQVGRWTSAGRGSPSRCSTTPRGSRSPAPRCARPSSRCSIDTRLLPASATSVLERRREGPAELGRAAVAIHRSLGPHHDPLRGRSADRLGWRHRGI